MKIKIGLDIGTNSVGWAVVNAETNKLVNLGSRIIPMDAATLGDFEKGNLQSPASERTGFRGIRRMYERSNLRRERLHRVLHIMDFLPEHYAEEIDFDKHPGKFKDHGEPLLPYRPAAGGSYEFIFKESFHEMLEDFHEHQPELISKGRKIPYDWTLYYLRKKALREEISREELAWVILCFNTKRGYYQTRSDQEEKQTNKREEYKHLRVKSVTADETTKRKDGSCEYIITYENDTQQKSRGKIPPREVGEMVEVIMTTQLEKDGSTKLDKEGNPKISVRTPKEDDWTLVKKRKEHEIDASGLTVGEYIYTTLLQAPDTKVRGQLIHTIDRGYYKEELRKILDKQKEYHSELQDDQLYEKALRELYRNNEPHVNNSLANNNKFTYLFVDDIIFYQRPLKSKKSEIADCPLETYQFTDSQGETTQRAIKCIPRSNPIYEEFRLWQFIRNLRIYQLEKTDAEGRIQLDVDITGEYIKTDDDIASLYQHFRTIKEINQKNFLKYFKLDDKQYRWNYMADKKQPSCPTHYDISKRISQTGARPLTDEEEMRLWHILYSVSDKTQLRKALDTFARKHQIDREAFVETFESYPTFESSYGAYSEKAIKKLLPLIRAGKYWKAENIDLHTRERIEKITTGEADDTISEKTREELIDYRTLDDFRAMPFHKACYAVYNRHAETSDTSKWETPEDIDRYLKEEFKQHSLRNPVVEQILGETLRVVRDIWQEYGQIAEVHVEMGRELKQTNEQRKRATERISKNEETNFRIRRLLQEFAELGVDDVIPESFSQQDKFKIYEANILQENEMPDDIKDIWKKMGNASSNISKAEVIKYRLWLEQKYQSPYTGRPIPLSKLFTTAYQIEHVIPRSRYYDDSYSNKVICESEVNKYKDRMLGYEFIARHGGEIIKGDFGQDIKLFDTKQYETFITEHYKGNRFKMKKLLAEEIPTGFNSQQLNNTRYISRITRDLLSKIVRDEDEQGLVSKHVVSTNGNMTDRLKRDWGLNEVWNELIAPRFQRLNMLEGTNKYGTFTEQNGQRFFRIDIPLEISRGFSKKRIDHRHHALDAAVIAYTDISHVQYFNNESSRAGTSGRDIKLHNHLRNKLCKKVYNDSENYSWMFQTPYEEYTRDVRDLLTTTLASFKQNLRVINKMTNYYQCYDQHGRKVMRRQTKGDGWAVRKSLHKETVYGAVRLPYIKTMSFKQALEEHNNIVDKQLRKAINNVAAMYGKFDKKTILKYFKDRKYEIDGKKYNRVDVYQLPEQPDTAACRTAIDETFTKKNILSVTDSGIRAIMLRHLEKYDGDHKTAFSPEGLADMNANIKSLNGGKDHKPIYKVRKSESLGVKFTVGSRGTKSKKFVEGAKGTNLFFAIYTDQEGERNFETIPFYIAVDRLKAGEPVAPRWDNEGRSLLFTLSPEDLVYVPKEGEEIDSPEDIKDYSRIYKMVSCTEKSCHFIPSNIAMPIVPTTELGSNNKSERDWTYEEPSTQKGNTVMQGNMIKKSCIKLKLDRLGKITGIKKQ